MMIDLLYDSCAKIQQINKFDDQLLCSLLLSTGFSVPFPGTLGIFLELISVEIFFGTSVLPMEF